MLFKINPFTVIHTSLLALIVGVAPVACDDPDQVSEEQLDAEVTDRDGEVSELAATDEDEPALEERDRWDDDDDDDDDHWENEWDNDWDHHHHHGFHHHGFHHHGFHHHGFHGHWHRWD